MDTTVYVPTHASRESSRVSHRFTTARIREIAIDGLAKRGTELGPTLPHMYGLGEDAESRKRLWFRPIQGSFLENIVEVFDGHGVYVDPRYGLLRLALGFSPKQMHHLTCGCIRGRLVEHRATAGMIKMICDMQDSGLHPNQDL